METDSGKTILLNGRHAFFAALAGGTLLNIAVGAAALGSGPRVAGVPGAVGVLVMDAVMLLVVGGLVGAFVYCITAHLLAHYIIHRRAGYSYLGATWRLLVNFAKATWGVLLLSGVLIGYKMWGSPEAAQTALFVAQCISSALFWVGAACAVYEWRRRSKLHTVHTEPRVPQVRR